MGGEEKGKRQCEKISYLQRFFHTATLMVGQQFIYVPSATGVFQDLMNSVTPYSVDYVSYFIHRAPMVIQY
ncbi:MAG: hypothetical protein IJE80_05310, partial [Peptococcaceae bacterium]|nr:hypothetical protein [Peptococcaceae bacterium]